MALRRIFEPKKEEVAEDRRKLQSDELYNLLTAKDERGETCGTNR
jgi:hypothetical protein